MAPPPRPPWGRAQGQGQGQGQDRSQGQGQGQGRGRGQGQGEDEGEGAGGGEGEGEGEGEGRGKPRMRWLRPLAHLALWHQPPPDLVGRRIRQELVDTRGEHGARAVAGVVAVDQRIDGCPHKALERAPGEQSGAGARARARARARGPSGAGRLEASRARMRTSIEAFQASHFDVQVRLVVRCQVALKLVFGLVDLDEAIEVDDAE